MSEAKVRRLLKRKKKEINVEARAVKHAKEAGWLSRKMNGLGFAAWPDRLFIPRRAPLRERLDRFWVEFKRVGEAPTPMQDKMHADLRARGEAVYVIDNIDDFKKVFHDANSS